MNPAFTAMLWASLPKAMLTDYVSSLRPTRLRALDQALRVALALA